MTSSSSLPMQSSSSAAPITSAALLSQHASASNPYAAALEQAVTDRNSLAAQNTQLWKLVEKQRTGYGQILRELERVRGERDTWKSRAWPKKDDQTAAHTANVANDAISKHPRKPSDDQAPRSSSSASSQSQMSILHSERQRSGSASSVRSLPNPYASTSAPNLPVSSSTTSGTTESPKPPAQISSIPEATAPPTNLFFPSLGSSPVHARSIPSHPPPPPSSKHHHHADSTGASSQRPQSPSHHHPQSQRSVPNPSPLGHSLPVRSESLPSDSQQNLQFLPSYNASRKMSLTENSGNSIGSSPSANSNSQPPMLSPDLALSSPNPPFMHSRASRDSQGSHDSRITLPEEARAYIVNMADSPIPSPRLGQFVSQPSSLNSAVKDSSGQPHPAQNILDDQAPSITSTRRATQVTSPEPGAQRSSPSIKTSEVGRNTHGPPPVVTVVPASAGPLSFAGQNNAPGHVDLLFSHSTGNMLQPGKHSPAPSADTTRNELGSMFLDMGEESGLDDGSGVDSDFNDRSSVSGTDNGIDGNSSAPETMVTSDGNSTARAFEPPRDREQGKDKSKKVKRAVVEDFPLPPGPPSSPPTASHVPSSATTVNGLHVDPPAYDASLSSANLHLASASTSTTTLLSASSSNLPSAMPSSSNLPSTSSSFLLPSDTTIISMSAQDGDSKFRALPLLTSDLPHTNVTVSSSFVRPNERGKEVLSFTVHVSIDRDGSRKSKDNHSGDTDSDRIKNKEGWTVEKMYSDVLALDQRVRATLGRNAVKRIATLPEGKLWRDHAPAKVDQRKAVLENYLQTLVALPVKSNDEVIAFLTSDIVREAKKPVLQAGHKEGYLTKRGKNFGGWKTRYFVLQGPALEYYDCRGGTHLGSIQVAGAQIGRQQRSESRGAPVDDEKEYRHAFLIVENRKNAAGSHPRHVLCAESDEDRDSWVEMLVRYFTGVYSEDPVTFSARGVSPIATSSQATEVNSNKVYGNGHGHPPPRSSNSIDIPPPYNPREASQRRAMSKDDIMISKNTTVPISRPAPDGGHANFFQSTPILRESSPVKTHPSPVEREKLGGLPSSLPESGPLAAVAQDNTASTSSPLRSNSEMGHRNDLYDTGKQRQPSPEKHRERDRARDVDPRKSFNPSVAGDRVPSPDKMDKVKMISGPLGGAPIPAGYKFGGKDASEASPSTPSDRREKAKSRSFWGFGGLRPNDKLHPLPVFAPRAVFGVPLEESLDVAQIANLPAIVFRAIQYLEAKRADQEEGIYRLSGSTAVIKGLRDRFNAEGDVDLLASDEFWDPHAIAGLLKSFLRELPASILTRDHHLKFLSVMDFVDAQERIKELSQLIAALPLANYSLLRALTAHLILIVQNSSVNKMTMRNVGIVFSPTLGIPAGIFSLMLGEFNRVFNVDAADGSDDADGSTIAEEPVGASGEGKLDRVDLARRNSQRYSDTAADKLLGLEGRKLTVPPDEGQSDSDDISLQDESGTETTEDAALDSSSSKARSGSSTLPPRSVDAPETPTASKASKASHVAATRGLNVSITPSDRGHRYSRMMGLPSSPRPPISPRRDATSPEGTPQ